MTEVTKHNPGTFCWVDLSTTDAEAAKTFYTGLFGWGTHDNPMGPDAVYTMLQLEGKEVGGLYQQDQQKSQGGPPHWMSYVSVASADETVQKAKSQGGQVLAEPVDVFDAGRMAVLQDPTGTTFAVWQAGQHIGARLVNQPGTICWNELATKDEKVAGEFYSRLFGWVSQVQDMGPTSYTIFFRGDQMAAGMIQMTEEWGDIPPHWMVYFAVEDCDSSAETVKQLGGEIKVPPTDIPGIGRFAVAQDPQGAVFSIIKLTNPT